MVVTRLYFAKTDDLSVFFIVIRRICCSFATQNLRTIHVNAAERGQKQVEKITWNSRIYFNVLKLCRIYVIIL